MGIIEVEVPPMEITSWSLEYSCPKLIGVIRTAGDDHPPEEDLPTGQEVVESTWLDISAVAPLIGEIDDERPLRFAVKLDKEQHCIACRGESRTLQARVAMKPRRSAIAQCASQEAVRRGSIRRSMSKPDSYDLRAEG